MVANTISLAPKITEIQEFVTRKDVSLAFITETWLRESIADSVVDIPGCTILCKDRTTENHGGFCIYIKNTRCRYEVLDHIRCCDDHETLWICAAICAKAVKQN